MKHFQPITDFYIRLNQIHQSRNYDQQPYTELIDFASDLKEYLQPLIGTGCEILNTPTNQINKYYKRLMEIVWVLEQMNEYKKPNMVVWHKEIYASINHKNFQRELMKMLVKCHILLI